jgi:putative ABC transport system ATP-binding protein
MSGASLIRLEGVKRSYVVGDVTVHALRGIDLTIEKGTFVSVVGTSGSGKSTFMNLVGLLDRPTAGRYLLDGEDVSEFDVDRRAALRNRKIGFVFQSFNLLPRTTALEQVQLPLLYGGRKGTPREFADKARQLLELVGLGPRLDHTPSQLSGGQQQRVAIARALVNDPEVVLADEPTGNLDSRTSIEVMALLQDLNRRHGVTVVLITHEPDVAAYSDRIVQFRDGRVVSDRPVAPKDAAAEFAALPPVVEEVTA